MRERTKETKRKARQGKARRQSESQMTEWKGEDESRKTKGDQEESDEKSKAQQRVGEAGINHEVECTPPPPVP